MQGVSRQVKTLPEVVVLIDTIHPHLLLVISLKDQNCSYSYI